MAKDLNAEALALLKQFGLSSDPDDGDVYHNHQFKIITRQGIDKIMTKAGVNVDSVDVVFVDPFEIQLKGVYSIGEKSITTFASASVDRIELRILEKSKTTKNEDGTTGSMSIQELSSTVVKKGSVKQSPAYLPEMAEKRCNSRGVLKLTGFYDLGFYGQDEADSFNDAVESFRRGGSKPKSESSKPELSQKSI